MTLKKRKNKQNGFSLIEMMIALTVGLLIIAALTGVLISSARSSRANERTSELQNSGRYALAVVKRDLQHAGYHDLTTTLQLKNNNILATNNDCAAGFTANFIQKIWGSDDANPFAGTCIPTANYVPNTDMFVIRYASLESVPVINASNAPDSTKFAPQGTVKTLYFRSSFGSADLTQGNAVPSVTNTPANDHTVQVHLYYIAPWSNSVNENPQVPSLRRMVLDNTTGTLVDELVTSGIENMQVRYGVADSDVNGVIITKSNPDLTTFSDVRMQDANNVDANTVTGSTPWSKWGNVQSVRIWLLARNPGSERSEAYVNNTQYPMGNRVVQPNDQFRRQLYTTTVDLRNQ